MRIIRCAPRPNGVRAFLETQIRGRHRFAPSRMLNPSALLCSRQTKQPPRSLAIDKQDNHPTPRLVDMPPRSRSDADPPPSCYAVAKPNTQDEFFMPFLNACRSDSIDLALRLVPGREAWMLTDGLNQAMQRGNLTLARRLFELGVMYDADTIDHSYLSLEAGKLLFEFGFQVNDPCVWGATFLTGLVKRNDIPYVRYALELGADPNLGPSLISSTSTSIRVGDMRPAENMGCCLNDAAAYSTPEMFALLLEYGAKLENAIPLHFAAGYGLDAAPRERIPMMEYLIGLGVDVNGLDQKSNHAQYGTPLQCAIKWGKVEEGKWLLRNGADPDKKSQWGSSARDYAARWAKYNELGTLLNNV
ncbi:ankyrin repeat-containing domain protein [Clohesyomyces aquaticus]|uniref:Ankyrin repeat-containing domain protein n=1 Tax=Clohesyomyces aquaticus TaxID=1231657 RepID=A0A1Y1Y7U4_9PLEO|nr:ankyrin repeat-containing domain protein [Clohesyomyces aquaticus]